MKNNWKEEFEKFVEEETMIDYRIAKDFIPFITKLLAEQKKELIDELPQELGESERNEAYKKGFNFCREKIIHIINNLKV